MFAHNCNRQRGFGLVELAIGILIIGIIFVGIAKLNVANIKYSAGNSAQVNATQLAQFIYQRMLTNLSGGQATLYLETTYGDHQAIPIANCSSESCTATNQAIYDLYQWKQKFPQAVSNISDLVGIVCYSNESAAPTTTNTNCSGNPTDPIMIKLAWNSSEFTAIKYLLLKAPSSFNLAMIENTGMAESIVDIIASIVIPPPSGGSCTSTTCDSTIITSGSGCPSGQTCTNSVVMDGGCNNGADCSGSIVLDGGCTGSGQTCDGSIMVGSCDTSCNNAVIGGSCQAGASCTGAIIAGNCSGDCTNAVVFGNCTNSSTCTGATVYGICRNGSIGCVHSTASPLTATPSYNSSTNVIGNLDYTYFGLHFTTFDINKCASGTTCNNTTVGQACAATCNYSFVDGACNGSATCQGSVVNGTCSGNCDNSVIMGNCATGSSCNNAIVYGTCNGTASCTGTTCKNPNDGTVQPC